MTQNKILYLHGLDGSLSQEKKEVLERYFEIVAPQLDYRNTPDMFGILSRLVVSENIQAVIGNSMGGCFAYYLSLYHSLPVLCFNPALGYCPIKIPLPELKSNDNPIVFVLGGKDDDVPAVENFAWIRQNPNPDFILKWYNEMGHRIDIDTFGKETELFAINLGNTVKVADNQYYYNNKFIYYEWGNKPVLYDESQSTFYCYTNHWFPISANTAFDNADEITDESKIKQLFTSEIMQQYNDYMKSLRAKCNPDNAKEITEFF